MSFLCTFINIDLTDGFDLRELSIGSLQSCVFSFFFFLFDPHA